MLLLSSYCIRTWTVKHRAMRSLKGFLTYSCLLALSAPIEYAYGDIRLVDGPSSREGRLELFDGYHAMMTA